MTARIQPLSSSTTIILVSSTASAIAYIVYRYRHQGAAQKVLPWVPYAPVGMWETIVEMSGHDIHKFLLKAARAAGQSTFRLKLPLNKKGVFFVGDGKLCKEMLADPGTTKPDAIYGFNRLFVGRDIMFSLNNDYAKNLRKQTLPAFSRKELHRMNATASSQVELLIEKIKQEKEFDPSLIGTWLTFKIICEAAFEYTPTEEEFLGFHHHIDVVFRELVLKTQLNPLRRIFGRLIPSIREAYKSRSWLKQFASQVLDKYDQNSSKSQSSTLIKLLDGTQLLDGDRDLKVTEMLLWLIAGFDTTGFSLSHCLMFLAQNPRVQSKLRQAFKENPDADDRKMIDYCQFVVNETLRVTPILPAGAIRQISRDFVTDQGKIIPKGAIIFSGNYVSSFNPDIFENPEEFRPERWETPTQDMVDNFFPFTFGPRKCPGQPLAISELSLALRLLLARFQFDEVQKGTPKLIGTLKIVGSRLRATALEC